MAAEARAAAFPVPPTDRSCLCRSKQGDDGSDNPAGRLRGEIGRNVLGALCAFGSLCLYLRNVIEGDDV